MISSIPALHYRNYKIEIFTIGNVARPISGTGPELISRYSDRLKRAIDDVHDTHAVIADDAMRSLDVDAIPAPKWLRDWLAKGGRRIDLDRAHGEGKA